MRVLILEDDPILQIDMADIVTGLGFSLLGPFARATRALEACRADLPDMAVVDFNMGNGGDSSDLVDMLVAHRIPLAFVTGHGRKHLPERFTGVPLIEKPFDPAQVARFLHNAMPGPNASRG